MITFDKFASLYDFTLIEKGVQSFIVANSNGVYVKPPDDNDATREQWTPDAGSIAFFTAFQNQVFQKARPRVTALLNGISPFRKMGVIDANDQMRIEWWKARLTFQVVTRADYAYHAQVRAALLALIATIAPMSGDDADYPVGMNKYLDYHEMTGCEAQNVSTGIHIESGYYLSGIDCDVDFAVRPDKWPSN